MKLTRISFFFLCFSFLSPELLLSSHPTNPTKKLLLLDTKQKYTYCYEPFVNMAKSVGFQVNYRSVADIADQKINKEELLGYDAIFFMFCPGCINTLNGNIIAGKTLKLLDRFGKQPNKLVGIILPSNTGNLRKILPILDQIGIVKQEDQNDKTKKSPYTKQEQKELNVFATLLKRFIVIPPEFRTTKFHTTISKPTKQLKFGLGLKYKKNQNIALLPMKYNKKNITSTLLPYGIHWFNPKYKNHVFIGNISLLTFASISENFRLCPMEYLYRKQMLNDLQETTWELFKILNNKNPENGIDVKYIKKHNKPPLPSFLEKQKINLNSKPTKTAWMEIEIFKQPNEEEKQDLLIDYIYAAGLDYLWISISPNMYYSPIARYKEKKDEMLQGVSTFTRKLREKAKKLKIKIPKILVGIEIANDLVGQNLPKITAEDIYNKNYNDIPSPLNQSFWENEIIDSVKFFCEDWKKPYISNGIPIEGIVLDLEMYCRKTVGTFLSTMGFNKEIVDPFIFIKLKDKKLISRTKPINYLLEHKEVESYFKYLHYQATNLGKKMSVSLRSSIPNCTIGCYAPNIPVNWFYLGLFKGLCNGRLKKPLMLFTFNSEFDSHKAWLAENKIYAEHLTPIMLSKIRSKKDFPLMRKGNVWLNRFSRFINKYDPKTWYANEQSPLRKKKEVMEFMSYIRTL